MNRRFAAAALWFATAPFTACSIEIRSNGGATMFGDPKAERVDDAALPLAANGTLILREGDGDVTVHVSGETPRMVARWHGYGRNVAAAEAALATARFDVSGDSRETVLHAVRGEFSSGQGVRADVELWLPAATTLTIETACGDIEVQGVVADASLTTAFGDVRMNGATGKVVARSSSGAIELSEVAGDVEANSSFGDVTLRHCSGARLVAHTSSGAVTCSDAGKARIELTSNFGDVKLRGGRGEVIADSRSGSIRIDQFTGSAHVRAGFGSIELEGVFSAVDAETSSGDVELRCGEIPADRGDYVLASRFGDVELVAPETLSGDLDARTRFGSVDCQITRAASGDTTRDDHLVMQLRGGGAPIRLSTDSGDVRIHASHR